MKVILLKTVPKLGQRWDVKDVAMGYARNFLIPKGLVEEATPKALADLDARKTRAAAEAEADLLKMENTVAKLEGQVIELAAKASDEGTLYATVSPAKIAAALKEKGFSVSKDQIQSSHIKEIGEHIVVINLDHGLEARISLVINPE